jgi:hypothetical protein
MDTIPHNLIYPREIMESGKDKLPRDVSTTSAYNITTAQQYTTSLII